MSLHRIVMHWSAGTHTVSALDRQHYHFIVAGDGTIVAGKHPPEANLAPVPGGYAAHTLNLNGGSIGVAVAAMAGAVERPFRAGRYAVTPAQVRGLVQLCAELCRKHRIPVTRRTVLSHAEVQPTLGIKQRGKWDIAWLPGMASPGDPVAVGDQLRAMILSDMGSSAPDAPPQPAPGVYRPTLRQGDRGAEVSALQRAILATGYRPLLTDGHFGPATAAALRSFQRQAGLTPDAVAGPKTWAALTQGT